MTASFGPATGGSLRLDEPWCEAVRSANRLLAAGVPVDWAREAVPRRRVRIAVYGTAGAPFHHLALFATLGFEAFPISAAEIRAGRLAAVDVFVMPGGGARGMAGQIEPLGEEGARRVGDFVRAGGMYLGSCAGAFLGACVSPAFERAFPYQRPMRMAEVRLWNDRDAWLGLESPGVGRVRVAVEPSAADHPVLAGLPAGFELTHYNGPMFLPAPTAVLGARETTGLLRFTGRTDRFTPSEAFFGARDGAGRLFDGGVESGAWAAVAARLERGRVVLFGSHPEFGADTSLGEWDGAARLLVNAVLWQATEAASPPAGDRSGDMRLRAREPLAADAVVQALARARRALLPLEDLAASLRLTGGERPAWLSPDRAIAIFGKAPEEVWSGALQSIARDAREAAEELGIAADRVRASDWDPGDEADRRLLEQLASYAAYRSRPEDGQDLGFEGIARLAELAGGRLRAAEAGWAFVPGPPGAFPYEGMNVNPYHMVASSYLGAVGLVGGARLLARALSASLEDHLAVREMRRAARGWR